MAPVVMFAIFIAFYLWLQRRQPAQGRPAEFQWGWMVAIVLCACVAIVAGWFI